MSWARAALERNDRVEVVAADPQSRTFTVRVKDTGELRIVRADQLIAAPAAPAARQAPRRPPGREPPPPPASAAGNATVASPGGARGTGTARRTRRSAPGAAGHGGTAG